MKKYIAITTEIRRALDKAFKVDPKTINNALSYRMNSELCGRIRKNALQRGGVVTVKAEESECIFDSEGNLTQTFRNGAVMKINKKTSQADVYMDNKVMIHVDNIHISEIEALQAAACELK